MDASQFDPFFNFGVYIVLLDTRSPEMESELIWKTKQKCLEKSLKWMIYKNCWIRISIIRRKMRLFNELSDGKFLA